MAGFDVVWEKGAEVSYLTVFPVSHCTIAAPILWFRINSNLFMFIGKQEGGVKKEFTV